MGALAITAVSTLSRTLGQKNQDVVNGIEGSIQWDAD